MMNNLILQQSPADNLLHYHPVGAGTTFNALCGANPFGPAGIDEVPFIVDGPTFHR